MLLEATLHRIGGTPDVPRMWLPRSFHATLTAYERWTIASAEKPYWEMMISADAWVPLDDDEWMSARITLTDMSGQFYGTRPALIYRKPYDIPTYTQFQPRWGDVGLFSLGLRMLRDDAGRGGGMTYNGPRTSTD